MQSNYFNNVYGNLEQYVVKKNDYFLIRNIIIPVFFQKYFRKTKREEGKIYVLKIVDKLFKENATNYYYLKSIDFKSLFLLDFDKECQQVRDMLIGMCIFLSRTQKIVPQFELECFAQHITPERVLNTPIIMQNIDILITQLLFDDKNYQKVFKDSNITLQLVSLYMYFVNEYEEKYFKLLQLIIGLLMKLIDKYKDNFEIFNETKAMQFTINAFKKHVVLRRELTKLIGVVIEFYKINEITEFLKELVEPLEQDISPVITLKCICLLLYKNNMIKESFRQIGGLEFYKRFYNQWKWNSFMYSSENNENKSVEEIEKKQKELLPIIQQDKTIDEKYNLIEWCLLTNVYAIKGSRENRKHFTTLFNDDKSLHYLITHFPFLSSEEFKQKYAKRITYLLFSLIFEIPDIEKVKSMNIFTKPVGGVLIFHPFVIHSF